jgi:hypothetical protein
MCRGLVTSEEVEGEGKGLGAWGRDQMGNLIYFGDPTAGWFLEPPVPPPGSGPGLEPVSVGDLDTN